MSEGNQRECPWRRRAGYFRSVSFWIGAQTPAPGVRPFDSSGRETLKNLLGLRLECRAMVAMIHSKQVRQELLEATHGAGAFRMFRSTIRRLSIEKRWYRFREEALAEIARDWLEAHELPYR